MKRWYVVRTHLRDEAKALHHLRRQEFTAYLPRHLKRRSHARRIDWVPVPLFPGYMFVEMDITTERWRAIHSTVGVSHLICNGDAPVPLPQGIIEEMQAREDDKGMIPLHKARPFKVGDKVQVMSGALCDQIGLFQSISDDERIIILLNVLGREVMVRLAVEAVAAVA